MDHHLRQLERHDSPQERAAWLQARLRAGEQCGLCGGKGRRSLPEPGGTHAGALPENAPQGELASCPACAGLSLRQRIQLAAFCGVESARAVVTPELTSHLSWTRFDRWPLATWIRYPLELKKLVAVRAVWAAGMACLENWERNHVGAPEHSPTNSTVGGYPRAPRQALDAAKAWLECPCEEHTSAAYRATDWSPDLPTGTSAVFQATDSSPDLPADLERAWWTNPACMCPVTHPGARIKAGELAVEQAASYLGDEAAVQEAICAELVRWALGAGKEP